MAQLYGIIKIGVSPTITDANVQYLRDTDLGLSMGSSSNAVTSQPFKGEAATLDRTTITAGTGYSIGKSVTLVQNATSGNGAGLVIQANISGSNSCSIKPNVEHIQNLTPTTQNLLNNFYANTGTAFVRDTGTGAPITAVSTVPLVGTSTSGVTGTFILTALNGAISSIKSTSTTGSGYRVGDTVTLADCTAAFGGGNTAGPGTATGLTFGVTADTLLGGIQVNQFNIIENGAGYAAADTVTLSEQGSASVGTGVVTIATLATAQSTQGTNVMYPTGIMNTGTAGAIVVKDTMGNTVVLGAMQPGVIRPIAFSQVLGAGTGPAVGEVTILYGDH